MISKRCRGKNLINHLLQTNKIKNYEVNYIYEKNKTDKEWMCVLSFEAGNKKYSYIENSVRQRVALDLVFKKINHTLSCIAGID